MTSAIAVLVLVLAGADTATRREFGQFGESLAARALERSGVRIVDRSFRIRSGEIDLIGIDGDTVVFVEVKARAGRGFGAPAAAVSRGKQARIARVALYYLKRRGWLDRPCRFDVVAVERTSEGPAHVVHLADAFRPEQER